MNIMKILFSLIITAVTCTLNAQIYSGYYRANVDVDVNQKVDVSGNVNVNKTITSIDYGALANANAQRERNRIEQQRLEIEQAKYRNELEKQNALLYSKQAMEIAADPIKAHDYGQYYSLYKSWSPNGNKSLRYFGFLSYTEYVTVPHNSLFITNGNRRFENVSPDGITTEIIMNEPQYNYLQYPVVSLKEFNKMNERRKVLFDIYKNSKRPIRRDFKNNPEEYRKALSRHKTLCDSVDFITGAIPNFKEAVKMPELIEKKKFLGPDGDSVYLHKKEYVKRNVCGFDGYRGTMIWEDDFEKCITDNYTAYFNGITLTIKVRYKADKGSNITFEDLEGRRYYLLEFVEKHIRTRGISNPVFSQLDKTRPLRRDFKSPEDYDKASKVFFDKLR